MSQQPRQVPTHPSSPLKSSSRRTTSGGGSSTQPVSQQPPPTNTATARSLLPSPQFEDDPIVASHQQYSKRPSLTLNDPEYSEHAVAESENYGHGVAAQPSTSELIPSFQPFFTLIEDTVTNEHHHPTVHYIFADDDTDIITEAALRSLEVLDPSQATAQGQSNTQSRVQNAGDDTLNTSRLPPPVAGMREHYIVLDVHQQPQPIAQDGDPLAAPTSYTYEVSSAHSLSAEWQVLRTSISTAPTIGDNPATDDEGLMLRIEGRGNTPGDTAVGAERGKGKETETASEKESMEDMIERFQKRLEDVRMVMEAGGTFPGVVTANSAGTED